MNMGLSLNPSNMTELQGASTSELQQGASTARLQGTGVQSHTSDQRLNILEEMLYNTQLQQGASTSQLQQGASTSQLQQGASTSQLQQGALLEYMSMNQDVEFQRQKEGRPSTTRNEGSQAFRPRRALELKPNVLKRAGDTNTSPIGRTKTEGDVEKLALLTEEEYDVIRR
ncbi:hypothetical protein CDAR_102111 [Caerostris darwini]|uniref:Uncharacterized protein n=1 Tax=Caerostris darwini TaxID=1538125 RepID=A0AAV4TBB1_9ARAC|nr:hypothetical protein CDAR_102111 [Caerostris darwini]